MNIRRMLRHLFYSPLSLKRCFPGPVLGAIEAAVSASEALHRGEIRFAIEGGLPYSRLFHGQPARERAIEIFSKLRVWDTQENNGVLIYLLLADRDVEIVADRGIHALVGPTGWEKICRLMEEHYRAGRFEEGSLAGIRAIGELLARHFPAGGEGNPNELPDRPVVV
jgi:uncharacterized membrane protein